MPQPIVKVASPTHAVDVQVGAVARMCNVTLQGGMTHLDKDFVLLVTTSEPHRPRLAIEKGADGSHACMVTLAPKFQLDECKCELIFLIDRSGSMSGAKMNQAVDAMQLFLRSLPADCYFNIVRLVSLFMFCFRTAGLVQRRT